MIADGPYWEASRERVNRGRDVPSGQLARRLSRLRGVEGLATQHSGARHSPDCFTRLISLFPPCFSLLSPFFSLFRRDPDFDNPPETICFQMVDQKAPSRAEQDHNREIIRAYQGGNREITGAEQERDDSAGSSKMRRHSAPIQPLEIWRLKPADPRARQDGQARITTSTISCSSFPLAPPAA
jgi:hypothetical protein